MTMRGCKRLRLRRALARLPPHCHAEHWARNEDLPNNVAKRWLGIFVSLFLQPPKQDFDRIPSLPPDVRSCSYATVCNIVESLQYRRKFERKLDSVYVLYIFENLKNHKNSSVCHL